MSAEGRLQLSHRLKLHIAVMTGRSADSIDGSDTIGSFDIDSVDSIQLAMEVEKDLGHEIDPEIFLRSGSTIDHIIDRLIDSGQE